MVWAESNPVVLSRGGETHGQKCFVVVCIQRKTWILGDQGLVGFYRVSSDADQCQIWNCWQSEVTLGGDGIFSLSLFVRSMVSQYSLFWRNTFLLRFLTIPWRMRSPIRVFISAGFVSIQLLAQDCGFKLWFAAKNWLAYIFVGSANNCHISSSVNFWKHSNFPEH